MKIVIVSLLLFFCFSGNTQTNLVPNHSFEDTVSCPLSMSQIEFSQNWNSYGGSPDFFFILVTEAMLVFRATGKDIKSRILETHMPE